MVTRSSFSTAEHPGHNAVHDAFIPIEERLKDAIQMVNLGDYGTARQVLTQLSLVAPDDPNVNGAMGALYQLHVCMRVYLFLKCSIDS